MAQPGIQPPRDSVEHSPVEEPRWIENQVALSSPRDRVEVG